MSEGLRIMERVQVELLERKSSIAAGILDGSITDHSTYLAQCAEIRALDSVWLSFLAAYEAVVAEGETQVEVEPQGEES